MKTALNHMTTPDLGYVSFLDLAARLGCIGVEVRNDIPRPLFDDLDPTEAGRIATDKGLRLVGLSQVYPFNDWTPEREDAVKALIETAKACGAETISLIPRNDGTAGADGERQANLKAALEGVLPLLQDAGMTALVEPLGFQRSSLRSKAELIEAISAIGGQDRFRIVHDTFHHTLANGGPIYPEMTGIVHISAVVDPDLTIAQMEDEHRVLIDAQDRLGNVEQIAALIAAGYDGPISYECFSTQTHALEDPYTEIKRSFDFISSQLQARAA
ncbi:sugar epimerase [Salipiger sp. IMCC34102]|nr:sugar epimerase [Salipiger sp. IMCC34102]